MSIVPTLEMNHLPPVLTQRSGSHAPREAAGANGSAAEPLCPRTGEDCPKPPQGGRREGGSRGQQGTWPTSSLCHRIRPCLLINVLGARAVYMHVCVCICIYMYVYICVTDYIVIRIPAESMHDLAAIGTECCL